MTMSRDEKIKRSSQIIIISILIGMITFLTIEHINVHNWIRELQADVQSLEAYCLLLENNTNILKDDVNEITESTNTYSE